MKQKYLRILNVMQRAAGREKIVIGAIGGSITEGMSATETSKRFADLVKDWWVNKFPSANIEYVNAGIGATTSGFACFRAEEQLLKYNPDFVIVDFAVNDYETSTCSETMEGLIRQILSRKNAPAIMQIFMMNRSKSNKQDFFIPICEYYDIPYVSFQDRMKEKIKAGDLQMDDILADVVHPTDKGHYYAAKLITDKLEEIYALIADYYNQVESLKLKAPMISDYYQYTRLFNYDDISPLKKGSWFKGTYERTLGYGWAASAAESELFFELPACKTVSILYKRDNDDSFGIAEAWVDEGLRAKLDSYYENPGPYAHYQTIAEKLEKKPHLLHLRIVPEKNAIISDKQGNYFELINVFLCI